MADTDYKAPEVAYYEHRDQDPTPNVRGDDVLDKSQQLGVDVSDLVASKVAEDDMVAVSAECMSLRSPAGWRIMGIMFVMGMNQAAYGIDWAVIGNINAFPSWHAYFDFETSGPVLGTLNALMSIGTFCGAPFLALADVWGRRSVNFIGNFLVIIGAILQSQAPNIACFM